MKAFFTLALPILIAGSLHAGTITSAGTVTDLTSLSFGIGTDVADLDANMLGREGFVLFNSRPEGENQGNRPWDEMIVDQKPAYISNLDGSIATSSGGWANYDNVLIGSTEYNTGGIVLSPGSGVETELFRFTVGAGAPDDVRIGIIADHSDSGNWNATNIRVEQDGRGDANQEVDRNGGLDVVQFDIEGVADGETYIVYATSAPSGALLGGITFDIAPDLDAISDPTSTDGDNLGDNWENFYFGDLTTANDTTNSDTDGFTDLEEWNHFINNDQRISPLNGDTDSDNLTDDSEVNTHNTDPLNSDSDGDGFNDGKEIRSGSDPNNSASIPLPSPSILSVDFQGIPGIFADFPVLMEGATIQADLLSGAWNALDITGHEDVEIDPSWTDLVNALGNPTSVGFSITGTVSSWTNGPSGAPVFDDYLFVNAGGADASVTWQISGLVPNSSYTFYPYAAIARDMSLTVDTNGDGELGDETPTLVPTLDFVEFSVTSSASGNITGTIDPGNSGEANWGGFELMGALPGAGANGLAIQSVEYDGEDVFLTWRSVPGAIYTIESSTTLNDDWVPMVTDLPAAAAPATTTTQLVDSPGETKKFYRVTLQ